MNSTRSKRAAALTWMRYTEAGRRARAHRVPNASIVSPSRFFTLRVSNNGPKQQPPCVNCSSMWRTWSSPMSLARISPTRPQVPPPNAAPAVAAANAPPDATMIADSTQGAQQDESSGKHVLALANSPPAIRSGCGERPHHLRSRRPFCIYGRASLRPYLPKRAN